MYGLFTLERSSTVMAAVLCRVCLSDTQANHSTALFSKKGLKLKWSEHLSELLLVPVSSDDNLPPHICRSCKCNVESVESKLVALRKLARYTHYTDMQRKNTNKVNSKYPNVHVFPDFLGIQRMRKQCVPGRFFLPRKNGLGTRLRLYRLRYALRSLYNLC